MNNFFNFLCILTIISASIFGSEYKEGDALYIWARNGVNLRDKPSINSNVIKPLKYGTKLKLEKEYKDLKFTYTLLEKSKDEPVGPVELHGYWIKVEADGKEGYLFNKLCLVYEPCLSYETWNELYFHNYLQKIFKLDLVDDKLEGERYTQYFKSKNSKNELVLDNEKSNILRAEFNDIEEAELFFISLFQWDTSESYTTNYGILTFNKKLGWGEEFNYQISISEAKDGIVEVIWVDIKGNESGYDE